MTTTTTETIVISPRCIECGHESIVPVTTDEAAKLKAGVPTHEALPNHSREIREQVISGTHPECWEAMFG